MRAIPAEPCSLEQVIQTWPAIRQSLASNYDDCPLSAWFSLKYAHGWSTTPQARGTIFHRTAAEILWTMKENKATTIPRREALAILLEVCHQRTKRTADGKRVPILAEDIVRVPMRQMPELTMVVDKFAKDNQFSTSKITDIERQLSATVRYADENGELRERTITGTLDALLYEPDDRAVVLDWKDTWALPPEPKETEARGYDDEELKGLSYHGYFQQRWYGYLVLSNFRNINSVTLREFYPRKTKARKATVHRHQLEDIEQEIAVVVAEMDRAFAQGAPNLRPLSDGTVDIDALAWWKPQPGKHCGFCNRPTACPIEEDVRVANGGAVSEATAAMWAARMIVSTRIAKIAREGLKGLIDAGAPPVAVRWAKGRQVIGWFTIKGGGRRFGFYTPDDSDRGAHPDLDAQLIEAMKESTARARAERGVQPRKRGTRK